MQRAVQIIATYGTWHLVGTSFPRLIDLEPRRSCLCFVHLYFFQIETCTAKLKEDATSKKDRDSLADALRSLELTDMKELRSMMETFLKDFPDREKGEEEDRLRGYETRVACAMGLANETKIRYKIQWFRTSYFLSILNEGNNGISILLKPFAVSLKESLVTIFGVCKNSAELTRQSSRSTVPKTVPRPA